MSSRVLKVLAGSGGEEAYSIDQSILLNHDDSTYLWYEPGAGGSRTTWTFSGWFKPGPQPDGYFGVFGHQGGSGAGWYQNDLSFTNAANMKLDWQGNRTGSSRLVTSRQFRDQSAWYHIVFAVDTTQGTSSNRMKLYINGVQETGFDTETYPGSSEALVILKNGDRVNIGRIQEAYFGDCYVAEVHIVDGSQLAPTSFGEVDSSTGQWVPIEYEGSHGTQGAYLKFASGAIGTDSSGNGNNWTAVNLANGDVMLDTPTNNFPTINALEPYNTTVSALAQGNLNIKAAAYSSGNYGNHYTTFILPSSGKWYIEMLTGIQAGYGNVAQLGISSKDPAVGGIIPDQAQVWSGFSSTTGLNISLYANTADFYDGGSSLDQDTGLTADSYVCALAVDIDNDKVWVGYDGGSSITWLNSGNPATGSNGAAHTFTSSSAIYMSTATSSDNAQRSYIIMNFGQNGTFCNYKTAGGNADGSGIGNFFYAPPSGFKALCSQNLPTPTVKKSSEHFNTVLYTGTGNTDYDITGVGFQPDLNWIKKRNEADDHVFTDSVRGAGKVIRTNNPVGEQDWTDYVGPFLADGIRLNDVQQGDAVNESGKTYAMWNWKAGGSSTTNVSESGSGTSRINASSRSVNTTAGFSIIKYTGSNDEISNGQHTKLHHGLSQAPDLVMVKNLDEDEAWTLMSSAFTFNDYTLFPSSTTGLYGSEYMGTTDPDSTYIYLGNSDYINDDGNNYIAYVWHEVEGYSKFGIYEGNNNANGPFLNTGFTPSWIILKYIDANGEWWWMLDTTRDPYHNLVTEAIYMNTNSAEGGIGSGGGIDVVANGFKIKGTNGGMNGNTNTYFYMAFAEFPFKYATAR